MPHEAVDRSAGAPPFDQIQRRTQGLALAGHPVFLVLCAGLNRTLDQDSIVDQSGKAIGEDVAANTQMALEFVEACGPLEGRPHDQQAPAIADLANGTVHATVFHVQYLFHDSFLCSNAVLGSEVKPREEGGSVNTTLRNATFATHNHDDSALSLIRQLEKKFNKII